MQLTVGERFSDPGATAYDAEDGDLTGDIQTQSTLDNTTTGTYTITYSVSDSFGATASVVRSLEVTAGVTADYDVDWMANFTLPEQDENGWSLLTPSEDSRLIYVSSSAGDNDTAQFYAPDEAAIGDDLYHPTGAIKPFATIDATLTQSRDGYPDYVLLKRGDTWQRAASIVLKSGRSISEKTVLRLHTAGREYL